MVSHKKRMMAVLFAAAVVTAAPPQFSYDYKAGFVGAGNDVISPEPAASIEVSDQMLQRT